MSKAAAEEKASKVIPEYMVKQNRPYGATDVWNNLHQEFGKTLVIKCLDAAVESGILREKVISKQKIYFANQDNMEKCNEEELAAMDKLIAEKASKYQDLSAELKALQNELKVLESSVTTSKLAEKLEHLEQRVTTLEKQINDLEGRKDSLSTEEKTRITEKEKMLKTEWRKRKRVALQMFSAIHENCPLPKKQLLEEIGIELDESSA